MSRSLSHKQLILDRYFHLKLKMSVLLPLSCLSKPTCISCGGDTRISDISLEGCDAAELLFLIDFKVKSLNRATWIWLYLMGAKTQNTNADTQTNLKGTSSLKPIIAVPIVSISDLLALYALT